MRLIPLLNPGPPKYARCRVIDLVEDDNWHELDWELLDKTDEVLTGFVLDRVVAKGEDDGWALARTPAEGQIGEMNGLCLDIVALGPCEDSTGCCAAYVDA